VSIESRDRVDYDRVTISKARVMRELEAEFTAREAAERLGMAYETVRSNVEDLKTELGVQSVREIRRWWRANREGWGGVVRGAGGRGG
jgi:DNA-binding CsgD family transcriptional regulator